MSTATPPRITRSCLLALPRAPDGLRYLAIGPYYWGASPEAVKALANARANGGAGVYTLHLVNEGAEVDSVDGAVLYNSKTPGIRLAFATVKLNGLLMLDAPE